MHGNDSILTFVLEVEFLETTTFDINYDIRVMYAYVFVVCLVWLRSMDNAYK